MQRQLITQNVWLLYSKILFLMPKIGHWKNGSWIQILDTALSYDCNFWYTCVKWWHLTDAFFIFFFLFFFFLLIFLVVRGIKWQKMAQNDEFFCLSHSVSQELYIIWFLVDWCKMMISPAIFSHFFKILIFWCFGGEGKRAKNDTYYQFQSVTIYISGTVNHMKIVGTQVQGV